MKTLARDLLLFTVCAGLLLTASVVSEDVPVEMEPSPPSGVTAESVEVNLNDTTTTTTTDTTTTSTTSTTPTTTPPSTASRVSSSLEPSPTTSPAIALARANVVTPTTTPTTTTAGTTSKPSAKRQISLGEFQQLVAKVNDEIALLRNQSANLSQTYDELVRRYNERTSQIPIVLYDIGTEGCSNDTGEVERTRKPAAVEERPTTTTIAPSTSTASSTWPAPPASSTTSSTEVIPTTSPTEVVPTSSSTVSTIASLPVRPEPPLGVVQPNVEVQPANAQTQIYGNKYYNYVHYFMYPPTDEQLKELLSPAATNKRRKDGQEGLKAGSVRYRTRVQPKYEPPEVVPASAGVDEVPVDRGRLELPATFPRRQPSIDRDRPGPVPLNNLRFGLPYAQDAVPVQFPREDPLNRRRNEQPLPLVRPLEPVRPPIVPFPPSQERNPLRPAYLRDEFPLVGPARPKPVDRFPEPGRTGAFGNVSSSQPAPLVENLSPSRVPTIFAEPESFLERRRKVGSVPSAKKPLPGTSWRSALVTERPTSTTPSLESLLSVGLKSVSFSIPTTIRPVPGVARNGWDGYDFSFVRKVQASKQKNGAEPDGKRSRRAGGWDL